MRALIGLLLVLAVAAGIAGIATYAYHQGVAEGIVQSTKLPAPGPGAGPYPGYVYPMYPYGYPFHGPFGFGFFGLLWPILLIVLLVVLLRRLYWRGHACGRPWGYSRSEGVPPWFEEWHRRTHESKGAPGSV